MALLEKFDEGGSAPVNTISIYGLDYDMNDLDKSIYAGLNDYTASLPHGRKLAPEIAASLKDLWEGVKSGRVTFNGSYFTDVEGEYKNAKRPRKDSYGKAAYYLADILNKAQPVEKPVPVEFKNTMLGEAVAHDLFGVDTNNIGLKNLQAFIDLDALGEDYQRPYDKRREALAQSIYNVYNNFDTHFGKNNWTTEQTDEYKNQLLGLYNLLSAQGELDPSYAHEMNKILGTFNNGTAGWSDLLQTDFTPPPTEEELRKQKEEEAALQKLLDENYEFTNSEGNPYYIEKNLSADDAFVKWMDNEYGEDVGSGKFKTISKLDTTNFMKGIPYVAPLLSRKSPEELRASLQKYFTGGQSNVVNGLQDRFEDIGMKKGDAAMYLLAFYCNSGLAEDLGNGMYVIPEITNRSKNRVLTWNSNNGSVQMVSSRVIPSIKQGYRKAFNEILRQNNIKFKEDGGTLSFKEGGVVGKFADGDTTDNLEDLLKGWYQNQYDTNLVGKYTPDYIKNLTRWETYRDGETPNVLNRRDRFALGSRRTTDNIAPKNGQYDPQDAYAKQLEGTDYYKAHLNELKNSPQYAEWWARGYANEVGNKSNKWRQWFSNLGEKAENSEGAEFNHDAFKKYLEGDKNLTIDQLGGPGHDIGRRLLYAVKNGDNTYYNNEYNPDEWELDGDVDTTGDFNDIQYLKRKTPAANPETKPEDINTGSTRADGTSSKVNPTGGSGENGSSDVFQTGLKTTLNGGNLKNTVLNALGNAAPFTFMTALFLNNIRSNKRQRDTLLAAEHPALENTYERYSPIRGAFGLMQAGNRSAAGAEYLANNQPGTDYADILRGKLVSHQNAEDTKLSMKLKDNDAIRESEKEALERREDNMKRRTETANTNRAKINESNRRRAEINADYELMRNNNLNSFLRDIQSRLEDRLDERRSLVQAANSSKNANDYLNAVWSLNKQFDNWYKKKYGKDPTYEDYLKNDNYVSAMRELSNTYSNVGIGNLFNRGIMYSSPSYATYPSITSKYQKIFSRQGGKLFPKLIKRPKI